MYRVFGVRKGAPAKGEFAQMQDSLLGTDKSRRNVPRAQGGKVIPSRGAPAHT